MRGNPDIICFRHASMFTQEVLAQMLLFYCQIEGKSQMRIRCLLLIQSHYKIVAGKSGI